MKTYHIETYGCQMNVHDSEKLAGMLEKKGYAPASSLSSADVIVFNTCCVREHAEDKVFGNVGALKSLKEERPDVLIAVCGCMMQQDAMADTLSKKFPFVNLIFGTHNLDRFDQMLDDAARQDKPYIHILPETGEIAEGLPVRRNRDISAFVNVMYGCDNYCSYCIVPYVRGRERSREPEAILSEIGELARSGCMEVMLLGQNVNSYGKGLTPPLSFAELLRSVASIEGIRRVRFMTSHPKDLTEDIVYAIRDCPAIANHIHLPVQSGSNRILKMMNRRYSREKYMDLAAMIRETVPGIAITSDIIVGFPGESEADFADTLDLVKTIEFDAAFTFKYSIRTGTKAAGMPDQIPEKVKKERLQQLMEVQTEIGYRKNLEYVGRQVQVLFDSESRKDLVTGRTGTNKLVKVPAQAGLMGAIRTVRIREAESWSLRGDVL
jgi:tRNA-2-methylthio-N6-dimethylallyladenosine synthase